jgi:hypothetical protein
LPVPPDVAQRLRFTILHGKTSRLVIEQQLSTAVRLKLALMKEETLLQQGPF